MTTFYTGQTDYIAQLNNLIAGALTVTAMTFAAGSAASPSITFAGDTNTGIYRPAADSVGIACGGANIATFGTTSVTFAQKIVQQGTTSVIQDFYASSNASNQKYWRFIVGSNYFELSAVNDAYTTANPAFQVYQSAGVPSTTYLHTALRLANGTNDRLRMATLAAGSGIGIECVNAAENDYEPFYITGETIIFQARTGAGSALSFASIFVTGSNRYFEFNSSNAANSNIVSCINSDNTSGTSNARVYAYSGGSSGGDAVLGLGITGVVDWCMGVDNSDSDALVISNAFTPGSSNKIRIPTSGAITVSAETNIVGNLRAGTAGAAEYTLHVVGNGMVDNSSSSAGANNFIVQNTQSGTGMFTSLSCISDLSRQVQVGITSSGYTSVAVLGASAAFMSAASSGGICLLASGGSIRFAAGGTAEVARVDFAGILLANTKTLSVNSVQVISSRKTGWSTATGSATRTTFDTTTVTTQQLAERVKALIDDLHGTAGHGLIGT